MEKDKTAFTSNGKLADHYFYVQKSNNIKEIS